MRKQLTIYMDEDLWHEFMQLSMAVEGKAASRKLKEMVRQQVAAWKGGGEAAEAAESKGVSLREYERLKARYKQLVKSIDEGLRDLREIKHGVKTLLNELEECALQAGLKRGLSNFDETLPKLLTAWRGRPETHMHLFISLLEQIRERKRIERTLNEVRMDPTLLKTR
jgi:hypothetical protein